MRQDDVRGVPEKGDSNARGAEFCVLSEHTGKKEKRRRHSTAAKYANTQLFG